MLNPTLCKFEFELFSIGAHVSNATFEVLIVDDYLEKHLNIIVNYNHV